MNDQMTRKQFLIEESERHRLRLMEDFTSISKGCHQLTDNVGSFKAVASSAALLVTGLTAVQPGSQQNAPGKASWLQILLQGAGLAATIWLALQEPRHKGAD